MRVLHVMKGSEEIYGAERVIFAEMTHSIAQGIDAQFLMLEELRHGDNSDLMGGYAEQLGIPVTRLPVSGRISWSMIKQAAELAREIAPDVIHTHSYKGDVIGLGAAKLAKIPVVGEIHGWLFPKDDYLIRFYEWLDVQALKCMDRVVVLADHYRRLILRMGFDPQQVAVIPSGVDVTPLRSSAGRINMRQRLGIDPERPTVGALTRLSHEKGVDTFLRSVARLVRTHPNVMAIVFGTGPEEHSLKALADKLAITDHVVWAGYVEEAMDALLALDVVAQTSRYEALPQALMEAMVMARPIVATPVGGCPELVVDGETGYVVPTAEPELIAGAVGRLLSDPPHARRLGQAGAQRVEDFYTMKHWVQRIENLYRYVAKA